MDEKTRNDDKRKVFEECVIMDLEDIAEALLVIKSMLQKQIEQREEMFSNKPGDEPNQAEQHIQPELNPRPARILTPSFVFGLFLRLIGGFALGILFCLAKEMIFMR